MRPVHAWGLGVLIPGLFLGHSLLRARTLAREHDEALSRLRRVSSLAAEHAALSAELRDVQPTPASELPARMGEALASAGLPHGTLTSFDASGGAGRATGVLHGLTLPQLGRCLDRWRTIEPSWTVTMIELSPLIDAKDHRVGGDLPLRAVLVVEHAQFREGHP